MNEYERYSKLMYIIILLLILLSGLGLISFKIMVVNVLVLLFLNEVFIYLNEYKYIDLNNFENKIYNFIFGFNKKECKKGGKKKRKKKGVCKKYSGLRLTHPYLYISAQMFVSIIFVLLISEIILHFIPYFFKYKIGLNPKYLLVLGYVYLFSAIILAIFYCRIFHFSKIPKLIEKYNFDYEAVAGACVFSCIIHIMIIFILPEIPILVIRFLGFGIEITCLNFIFSIFIKNLYVNTAFFDYDFHYQNYPNNLKKLIK